MPHKDPEDKKKWEEQDRLKNPEKYAARKKEAAARSAKRYKDNPEKIRALQRESRKRMRADPKRYAAYKLKQNLYNRKHGKEANKRYRSKPLAKAKRAAYQQRREALKKDAILPTTCFKKIEEMHTRASKINTKLRLKKSDPEFRVLDHKIPISKGGAHHQNNLRIVTNKKNGRKGSVYDPKKYSCQLNGAWADNKLAKKKLGTK